MAMVLQAAGRLTTAITVEHYHDLGKLLFAFVVFWGYIAFSQYMLIWYANIPEETVWYLAAADGPWGAVSLVLLFGHLLIPFFGLLSRDVKRRQRLLGFWAVWLLVMHWLDLYWLVMPQPGRRASRSSGRSTCVAWWAWAALFVAGLVRGGRTRFARAAWPTRGWTSRWHSRTYVT